MKLRASSPALVISFIALVVALSATAYAATSITRSSQIKNGIITGADIKNNTVASVDIKNGTIATKDLSKSTLKRIDGVGGSSSNAAAIEGIRRVGPLSQPANQLIKVTSMTIPAGAYVITAKTTIQGQVVPNAIVPVATATCKLDAAGDEDQGDGVIAVFNGGAPGTIYMQTVRTVGGSATITLTCASKISWSAVNTSIIAHRVSSTTKTELGE